MGVRINPLGLLSGAFVGDIPLRVNSHLTIGPKFAYQDFNFVGTKSSILSAGVLADWHFGDAFQDSGYLSLQTTYTNMENSVTSKGKVFSRASRDLRFIGLIGYLWRWDNVTLNMAIGGGYTSYGNPDFIANDGEVFKKRISFPDIPVTIGADFSLGWAF